jgi:hypothetical protein
MLRKLIHAGAALVLLTGTAYAQFPMPSVSLGGDKPPLTPEQLERQKAIDNAYNNATKKIPEKKEAADPWGTVRPSQPSSPPAKSNANPPQAKNNTPPQAKNNPNSPQAKQ